MDKARSAQRVSAALIFYSLGIPAYFFQHVLVRTYYALHDSRKPATIAVCMVAFNLSLNLMLVFIMEEAGLALSTSISATVQACWLAYGLRKLFPELAWRRLRSPLIRLMLAAAGMAVVLVAVAGVGESMHWHKAVRLMSMLGTGVAAYFLAAWLLRVEELRSALQRRRPF